MLPKIEVPYINDICAWSPQIQPAGYHISSWSIYVFWSLYYIYQLLKKKHTIATTAKLRLWNDTKWFRQLIYCVCSNIWIDYIMAFGLKQEAGSLFTLIALAHLLHPIRSRSRNKHQNPWVGCCVFSWRPWFWSICSIYAPSVGVSMMVCWIICYSYSFLLGFTWTFQL